MNTYSAIRDASDTVLELLRDQVAQREGLLPIEPSEIVLGSPDAVDETSDARLTVFPYKFSRDPQHASPGRRQTGSNTYQNPPLVLNAHYLLTAQPPGDEDGAGQQLRQQQTVIGFAMQVIHDHSIVDDQYLHGALQDAESFQLTLATAENDEIEEIWNATIESKLQPSIIYEAGPVVIDSAQQEEIPPVDEREMDMGQTDPTADQTDDQLEF